MEQDHPGEVAEVLAEVLAEAAPAEAEWEVIVPGPDPVGTASAPVAAPKSHIKPLLPATT